MQNKESQNSKPKWRLAAIFKSSFSRRGKKGTTTGKGGEGQGGVEGNAHAQAASLSSSGDQSTGVNGGSGATPSSNYAHTDSSSATRGSRLSTDTTANAAGGGGQEPHSTEARCQSPAPSQAKSKSTPPAPAPAPTSSSGNGGENVRVSITVDTIKQQLTESLHILTEFKKSLRPSSDVQRYDEAVGSLEGAAKSLATLKHKLSSSSRKVVAGTTTTNRNSYVLPPPDLKVEFEDTPFSMSIPGIGEPEKESTLGVVQESKEGEVQEEARA